MTLEGAGEIGRCVVALLLIGCAVGDEADETTFGSASFDPTQATGSGTTTAGDPDASAGTDTSDEASSETSDADDDVSDTTTSSSATTDSTGDTGSSTTADNGMQPDSGMYSDCLSTVECVGQDACITVLDAQQNPIDGFCSKDDCVDPITDCDPSPGGTATPVCFSLTLMGAPAEVCALDCAGGASCPGGMTCQDVTGGSICV